MNQKDYLAFCRNELRRSKRWRGHKNPGTGYDEQWRRFIDLYHGLHYDHLAGTDQLTVNMVFSTINIIGPAVAINNPRFVVNSRSIDSAEQARVTEEVLNYLWRTFKYQRDFRLAVHDWMIVGHAWLKVGYKFVTEEPVTKAVEVSGPNSSVNQIGSEGGDEGIDDREPVEGNVESEMHVDDDRPFVERVSPFDMYVDPDARHPKEMRWVAQRTWRAVPDVHADSRYSATNRVKVTGTSWARWDDDDGDGRAGGDYNYTTDQPDRGAIGYCEIIEFYDLKRKEVSTWAVQGDDSAVRDGFLIKPTKMPYADGHPFVMMRNYEVPDHFYTMGDVQQIESLQLELNETRNQMLNFRKKYRRATAYSKDLVDDDGIRAIQSDEDNVLVPVQGDVNPAQAFAPIPINITPPEFFEQSALISNDMDQVSGVSDYARGSPDQNIKRTATEASMIQDAANARAQDRLMKIEAFLAEIGERVISLMQQFMTGEQVARVVTMPIQAWVNYDSDYLQGRFDYEVRGGSTEPRNETFRRQSAMQLVDASMPFLEMGIADPMALYMKILQDGFGEKDPQRFIIQQQPAPPPGQEQMPPGQEQMPPGQEQMPPGQEQMPPEGMPPEGMPPEMGEISPEELMALAQQGGGMPMPEGELTPEMLMALLEAEGGGELPPEMAGGGMPPMM